MNSHHYYNMAGSRRGAFKRNPVLFPCSPSALLSFCLVLVYLFSLARGTYGVSLAGGQGEMIQPLPQGEEEEDQNKSTVSSSVVEAAGPPNAIRVKRSRDSQQQLCGYRLLDALRNVCDRNFVGFTRRSDPNLIGSIITSDGGNDGQSGEDFFVGNNNNMNPWDMTLLTLEYPHSSPSSGANDILLSPNNANREGNSILDYLELLPQQPVSLLPMTSSSSFPWTFTRSNIGTGGGAAGRSSSSSKAFALKMLAEPPKTHQRFRRNIIDECCKKPCAMNQMLKYCAITAVGKRSY